MTRPPSAPRAADATGIAAGRSARLGRGHDGQWTRWLTQRAIVDVPAVCGLALTMRVIFRHAEPDTDPTYALLWGRNIAHGRLPDFSAVSAPTAHPLPIVESLLVSPLGRAGAADAILALSYLCLGAILWGTFRLAEAVSTRPVALLAAILVGVNFATLDVALGGFLDVQFLAVVVWAAVATTRARRPTGALWLLAVAGLLRPEAWLLAGVYWLYAFRGSRRRMTTGGLVVLAAPLAWIVMDLIVTGHPLFAFSNARQSSEGLTLGSYGHGALASFALTQLRNSVRAPVLLGGTFGLLLALRLRPSAFKVPAAMLVSLLLVFAAFTVLRLPVPNRMLLTPAMLFAIFCAYISLGWLGHAPSRLRLLWAAVGTAVIALLIATAPAEISRLHQLDRRRDGLQRIIADAVAIGRSHAARTALASCRTLTVGAPDIIPYTSYYLGRPLREISLETPTTPARGAYLALASHPAARFVLGDLLPQRGTTVPRGFRLVTADRSWRLFTGAC